MNIDKDFSRNVWCVLGLPFDAITLEQAADEIVSAVTTQTRCFLSTPNLNFVCAALTDSDFRESIILSDLSIVDGFPIVAVAKFLGIPMPERIGGSNLIEFLYLRQTDSPIKVYFLGGEDGVGEQASQNINRQPAGLITVGCYAPGFGTVEDMSSPDIIKDINHQDVDFLMISLGAKKGQTWIVLNRHRIKSTVIGYMGAVINFFAGTVKRAPLFIQKSGLEWVWRILQEPSLWRRYYSDGTCFLTLLLGNVIPYRLWQLFKQPKTSPILVINQSTESSGLTLITLSGACTSQTLNPLRDVFKNSALAKHDVSIDLKDVTFIDSAFLGLCLVLYKHLKISGHQLKLINPNKDVSRILKWQLVNSLLT